MFWLTADSVWPSDWALAPRPPFHGGYRHPLTPGDGDRVDADAARDFIRANGRGVLATFRSDGGVQMSPVDAVIDDDGYAVISSRETAMKVRNLRRNPRATFCAFTERFYGGWVYVEGAVELVSLPEAMEGLVEYYRRAAGEHPDWDEYRAAMQTDRRLLIRIAIDRAGPDVAG